MVSFRAGTDKLDVRIGDIYYADRGWNCTRPRFYKVVKITPKTVGFKAIELGYVHYLQEELKYGSNSPMYFTAPLEYIYENVGPDGKLDMYVNGKTKVPVFARDEEGRIRSCPAYRNSFNSLVRGWTHDSWRAGVRERVTEYTLKETGDYGGILTKWIPGTAVYGNCD